MSATSRKETLETAPLLIALRHPFRWARRRNQLLRLVEFVLDDQAAYGPFILIGQRVEVGTLEGCRVAFLEL